MIFFASYLASVSQVYTLECELTMLKGDTIKAEMSAERDTIDNDMKSSSNEFVVHVTKHASPPPNTGTEIHC